MDNVEQMNSSYIIANQSSQTRLIGVESRAQFRTSKSGHDEHNRSQHLDSAKLCGHGHSY
jgi:hypothetical protein